MYEHACFLCFLANTAAGYENLFQFSRLILLIPPEFDSSSYIMPFVFFSHGLPVTHFFLCVFILFLIFKLSLYIKETNMHIADCFLNFVDISFCLPFLSVYISSS